MASVELSVNKYIATITINTPQKLGALDLDGYYLLGAHLRKVAAMDSVTITILTGSGRYFSAGADVVFATANSSTIESPKDPNRHWFREFGANNIHLTRAFYTHPKILIAALNGPAIGLSAGLIGFADFIYATPDCFILTPFTSLGLVTEGGASYTFPRRMGTALANDALLLSKRIPAQDLLASGFINQLFPKEDFLKHIRTHVEQVFNPQILNHGSMLRIKKLMRLADENIFETVNVREAVEGVERFSDGIPQKEFARIANGQRTHKL